MRILELEENYSPLGDLFIASCSENEKSTAEEEQPSADATYQTMVETEEVIAELVTPIRRLRKAIVNLDITRNAKLFAKNARVVDLGRRVQEESEEG